MSSPAQAAANRANAQHSTGPRTDEGKARVGMNPLVHGLARAKIFLPGEAPEEFVELQRTLGISYICVHNGEAALVDEAALAWWKIRRINQWQTEIMTACMTDQPMPEPLARMFGANPEAALKTLHRYETSAHSLLNRALNHLRISQKEREHEAHPKGLPPEQAAMLAEAQDFLFGASTAVNRANPIGGPADPFPAPIQPFGVHQRR